MRYEPFMFPVIAVLTGGSPSEYVRYYHEDRTWHKQGNATRFDAAASRAIRESYGLAEGFFCRKMSYRRWVDKNV